MMNECHLILIIVFYYSQLWKLQKLCYFICQFVFLMSTLFFKMILQFEYITLLNHFHLIQDFILWFNLCYSVKHIFNKQSLLDELIINVIYNWLKKVKIDCKAIIYCWTHSNINKILFILNYSIYYFNFKITEDKKLVLKT